MVAGADTTACPHCNSADTEKLVSRVAKFRSEDARIDEMADRLDMMDEPESGSELRSIVRELGKAADDDASEELEAMFESDMEGTGDTED